ncbi:MAG TPA: winged helix-turn-helix domain-containing protein, partial [Aeromicrobium sp.]|nr:winged helix-turn-helix domain-containing protein [Aeromicrobium sp.]
GYDLVTGVFVLAPLAWIDRRPGITWRQVLRNWGLVFLGNAGGAVTVAVLMSIVFTFGFSTALVRAVIVRLGEDARGIDTAAGRLRVRATSATLDHTPVRLSPSNLSVLRLLASDPGVVFSREEVLSALPGDSTTNHAAEVAVARLRDAMGDPTLIRTVVKRGYQLALVDAEETP